MPIETKTFVEFKYPGSFFSETSSKEVDDRDPGNVEVPEGAFAFTFYDQIVGTAKSCGKDHRVNSLPFNRSGVFYCGGEVLSLAQVKALPGDHSILVGNMERNKWEHVIKCRTGNFQPFENGDVFLEAPQR